MNRFIAKRYPQSIATPMGAANQLQDKYPDLINFSLGDPDITTDERIITRAFQDALAGHTHYTDAFGIRELRRAIMCDYRLRYSYDLSPDEVLITTSGCHAMWLCLEALINEGDEVIIPSPFFSPYPQQVILAGGTPVFLGLSEESGYQMDEQDLEQVVTAKTKAIIINSPCNPTGAVLTAASRQAIAQFAERHDLIIIADDIYTAFSWQEPFRPITSIPGLKQRTITIGSFSKDYAMTGWRIGYLLADQERIRLMKDINENCVFSPPSISQRAALHALELRNEIQPPLVAEFKRRVFTAYERMSQLNNVYVLPPQATFYLFPSIKATGLSSQAVVDRLLEEAHVLTLPGNAFGLAGEGHIRFAVTVGEDKINEAFDRIERLDIFRRIR